MGSKIIKLDIKIIKFIVKFDYATQFLLVIQLKDFVFKIYSILPLILAAKFERRIQTVSVNPFGILNLLFQQFFIWRRKRKQIC